MLSVQRSENNSLLTIEEIASELKVSTKTVYYWVGRFEIPFVKIGRHLRFNRDVVLHFFERKTKERFPCLPDQILIENTLVAGCVSSPGSLKIRSKKLAET